MVSLVSGYRGRGPTTSLFSASQRRDETKRMGQVSAWILSFQGCSALACSVL